MSQVLPFNKVEMWHGHPDLYMNKLQEILKTTDDNDIGFFVKIETKYPDEIKEKQNFYICSIYIKTKDYKNKYIKFT